MADTRDYLLTPECCAVVRIAAGTRGRGNGGALIPCRGRRKHRGPHRFRAWEGPGALVIDHGGTRVVSDAEASALLSAEARDPDARRRS